jgi:hypothetical protein
MRSANDEPQKAVSRSAPPNAARARSPAFDFAGFILAQLGPCRARATPSPTAGCFEVIDMDGRRIDKVLVRRVTAHE